MTDELTQARIAAAIAEKDAADAVKVAAIRKADADYAEKMRSAWAARYAAQPPTFEGDLDGLNPKFLAWLKAQPIRVRDRLKAFWTDEAACCQDISHNQPRGQHARMTMVIQCAADRHGYEPDR